jgi:nucleotide-binding universal stress UspA family protein
MGAVVVGYVAKPEGEAAVEQGIAEARLRQSSLIVVNSHRGGRDFDDEQTGRSEQELSALEAKLQASGLDYDVRQLVRGFEPAEDLISIAESSGAELIVIGLRRRTPVGKLILGSNAQRILLDAPCPVLAVKVG